MTSRIFADINVQHPHAGRQPTCPSHLLAGLRLQLAGRAPSTIAARLATTFLTVACSMDPRQCITSPCAVLLSPLLSATPQRSPHQHACYSSFVCNLNCPCRINHRHDVLARVSIHKVYHCAVRGHSWLCILMSSLWCVCDLRRQCWRPALLQLADWVSINTATCCSDMCKARRQEAIACNYEKGRKLCVEGATPCVNGHISNTHPQVITNTGMARVLATDISARLIWLILPVVAC